MTVQIRPMVAADNAAVAAVIRQVSSEYGLTADRGFGVADPHLDNLYDFYHQQGGHYWVVLKDQHILGGAGLAPLAGGDAQRRICELQKMYFLPEARGSGAGKALAELILQTARDEGYKLCYLETTAALTEAMALYQKLGFKVLAGPMGETGHSDCEICMALTL